MYPDGRLRSRWNSPTIQEQVEPLPFVVAKPTRCLRVNRPPVNTWSQPHSSHSDEMVRVFNRTEIPSLIRPEMPDG